MAGSVIAAQKPIVTTCQAGLTKARVCGTHTIMRTLKVNVTQEDIDKAVKKNSRSCMIATAIRRAYPELSHIAVDIQAIRVTDSKHREQLTFLTPRFPAVEMLCAFDEGDEVTPFSFKLKGPTIRPLVESKRTGQNVQLRRDGGRAVKPYPKNLSSKYRTGVFRVRGLRAIGRVKPENPEAATQDDPKG